MTSEDTKDSPDIISCPPLVYLGALGLGLLMDWLFPAHWLLSESWQVAGGILGATGTVIGFWGVHAFHRAGTNVRPDRPVTALVTSGPFRYSRNPLYIALTVIYLGISLTGGSLWPLATLIPALTVVQCKIVRREEQYLESRFGNAYRAYKAQVHRWI
ncbi:MAG TPA: isoprenylcysteine carboxylmethyltransferase family protein [Candidatus Acidoferrum sp.]|nr:isoprenylcysteine carboxylmethyltransferase family protein [Candidatus Acidoferrum sp.]